MYVKNVHSALRPLQIYSQLFAIYGYLKVDKSKTILFANLILISIYVYFILAYDERYTQINVQSVISVLLMLCYIKNGRNVINVYASITEIDKDLIKLGIDVNYKHTFIKVAISVLMATFILITITAYSAVQNEVSTTFLSFLPNMVMFGVYMQYIMYMEVIRDKFEAVEVYLNGQLAVIAKEDFLTAELPIKTITKEAISPSDLSLACYAHLKICHVAKLTHKIFERRIILLLGSVYSALLAALIPQYGLFVIEYFLLIFWTVANFTLFVFALNAVKRIKFQSMQGPKILHRILNKDMNNSMHEMIEMHSLQMHHNRVQFELLGLFPFDYSVLHTLITILASYMILMMKVNSRGEDMSKEDIDALLN